VAAQEYKIDAGNKFMMGLSLLALVAVVVFLLYHLGNFLSQLALGERESSSETVETADQRMAPIGRVETAAIDRNAGPAAPKPASEVYQSVCAACHGTGAAGAPRIQDAAEWRQRFADKGLDTLVQHSIQGFQGMPARGGNPRLTDEEVSQTVAYMLVQAGLSEADVRGASASSGAGTEAGAAAAPVAAAPEATAPAGTAVPVVAATAVAGNPDRGRDRYASCISCHGPQGQGMGIFPKISGKSAEYIEGRLKQYRGGEMVGPTSPLMIPMASGLSDADIADLSAFIANF